jgi:hypothetical protein
MPVLRQDPEYKIHQVHFNQVPLHIRLLCLYLHDTENRGKWDPEH